MTIARLLLASAAFVGLTAFTDPGGKFSIDFPEGWGEPTRTGELNAVKSPDGKVNCNAYAPANAALAAATQEQINAEFSKPMDQAGWANILGVAPDKVEVTENEARPVGNTFLQIATVLVKKEAGMAPVDAKARIGVYIVPGYLIDAGCYAPVDLFDANKELFEKTISSLKPL